MKTWAAIVFSVVTTAAAAPTPEQILTLLKSRPEADEIRWKDSARGAPLKVRILQADARALTVEKQLPSGLTVRTIPLGELAGVTFNFTEQERSLHREPAATSIPALRVYWESRMATLRLAGSNASTTGLALAKSLRLTGETEAFDEAAKILEQIRTHELAKAPIELARAEQVTLDFCRLLKLGKADDCDKQAWKITEDPDNSDAMLLATAFLADRHFTELRNLEQTHPRWQEDDEVKPVRDRLYHLALDFSLYPSLFLGTREAESAVGLRRVVEIHRFTGDAPLLKNALEDLAALYPESTQAKETASWLARLKHAEASGQPVATAAPSDEAEGEITHEPAAIPTAPPPAKRYNIFGD